ncbi:aldo/keto reductase [Sulfurovum sp. ST-21]|uniref:Aldo/keto reductase n=1 Tax=Sulfurovum indicum TaxID=2779528 RepID=A0A7M1S7B7_9BACT|nr:aldo/keto reductase [Sulfurovum indicum]QOR62609.1 aldo/keto reductase [Sulfurovum indicum]
MKKIDFKGQKLSKLSFGTVQLGLDYGISNIVGKPTQDMADDIIAYLVNEGINCFDTAVAYGNSEEVLGHAIAEKSTVNLVSKVKSDLFTDNIVEIVSGSLKRLKTDKLFGLLLHDGDLLYSWDKKKDATVTLLQEQELIRYFGVSIYTSDEFDKAIENSTVDIIQLPFNLFDQRAIRDNWFKRAKEANKLIFIRSVFLQGLFFMDIDQLTGNLAEAGPYLKEMHTIRSNLNLSVSEFALAYVDSIATDAIILFGCDTLEQAKENIRSYNNLLTIDQATLNMIYDSFSDISGFITNPGQWRL